MIGFYGLFVLGLYMEADPTHLPLGVKIEHLSKVRRKRSTFKTGQELQLLRNFHCDYLG